MTTTTTEYASRLSRLRKSKNTRIAAKGYRRTSFDLVVPIRNALVLAAAKEDRPMVAIVEEALIQWLRRNDHSVEGIDGSVFVDTSESEQT